jgi:hypothetical protein
MSSSAAVGEMIANCARTAVSGNTVNLSMGPSALSNKTYQFDKVFSPAADQTTIFDEVVVPIIDEVRST